RAGQAECVAATLCRRQTLAAAEFAPNRLELAGRAVVQHLLEVTSGLDSQLVGENEIFGQAKKAFFTAQARNSAGPVLNRIFQKAFQAAKHVRTNTGISTGLVSISNVAVEVASRIFGKLGDTRVLLLGAGDIGLKSGRAFRSRGPGALVIASRSLERATEAAGEIGAEALPFEEALAQLGNFDVIVCSTASPGTIISTEQAAAALQSRQGRPLFLIDLALPRDVDAGVGGLKDAFVYNLDDLAKIAAENRGARESEIARCRAILDGKADALWAQVNPANRATDAAGFFPAAGAIACVA
ncbi:MAG: Glutamyl-tRNA reductase, partial [Lacunisphaera sp.]|nr:Glutamyl-tRNA reductase [Lacunisphaera sp.]